MRFRVEPAVFAALEKLQRKTGQRGAQDNASLLIHLFFSDQVACLSLFPGDALDIDNNALLEPPTDINSRKRIS